MQDDTIWFKNDATTFSFSIIVFLAIETQISWHYIPMCAQKKKKKESIGYGNEKLRRCNHIL